MAAPAVNINTANAKGLTNLTTCNATTGFSGFQDGGGGTPSPVAETDIVIEGSGAVSTKISGTGQNEGLWFDNTTGIDMTTAGRHLHIWLAVTTQSIMNTVANGGLFIKVASDASGNNWNKYFVAGSDFYPETTGGTPFARFVIDLNKTPSETAATAATLTSIRWFGGGMKSTGSAKAENFIIDRIDYGDGLQIEAGETGDPANWEALFQNELTNRYGIIDKRGNTYFLKGGVTIGDPTASGVTTLWLDNTGAQVVFENPVYHNGSALVSSIDAANLYNIDLLGNDTGTTDITFGQVVGTGDDRQGILGGVISSAGPKWTMDGETDISELDTVNLYGMTLQGAGITQYSSATKTDIIGCSFVNCDEIQPNDSDMLNCNVIAPVPDRGIEYLTTTTAKKINFIAGATGAVDVVRAWQVDESTTPDTFVEYTDECNSAATADVLPFPATEAVNDYFCVGHDSKFSGLSVDVGTAGAGGTPAVTWEYWSGSAWTALSGVTDNTSAFTSAGVNTVVWTVPTDWAATSLNDERDLFYVRARLTSVYTTTNPVLDEVDVEDTVEHHVHFPTHGTYTFNGMVFFGHAPAGAEKWHGENSETRQVITAGSFVIGESYEIDSVGSTDFTAIGAASNTVGVRFTATGVGSGTGTAAEISQINASSPSNPAENEFEHTGATAGEVRVSNTVNLTITVQDAAKNLIENAQTSIYLAASPFTELMNEDTNASGVATESYNYAGDTEVIVKVRKSDDLDDPRYQGFSDVQTIRSGGLAQTVTLKKQPLPI